MEITFSGGKLDGRSLTIPVDVRAITVASDDESDGPGDNWEVVENYIVSTPSRKRRVANLLTFTTQRKCSSK